RTAKYAHSVQTVEGTYFASILGKEPFMVNSFHHQAAKKIAPGFRAGILSPDGIVEAIESVSSPWIKAVQWHPERMDKDEPFSKALMEDFLRWCRR
ncbi:MAG: gamma-glutamyl-gamma-aminobutyrate hydrolase family protein, partial [Erysipelotrichaceae bacterium]|nr:gamma-glutamyl-gamma-aminobutyrate hydrolase family protein [Erysipelotrichaceae bacterium]